MSPTDEDGDSSTRGEAGAHEPGATVPIKGSGAPATTVALRLRGLTPLHVANAVLSAAPLVWFGYLTLWRHVQLPGRGYALFAFAGLVALLPWASRALARAGQRVKCDAVAVHAHGEALPYRTIREVRVQRTARRTTLHLVRSENIQLALVLRDAYAGRLEPLDVLRQRLQEHGFRID